MSRKMEQGLATFMLSLGLFMVVLGLFLSATEDLSSNASIQGAQAAQDALRNAAILCYASEGFYPPGLDYLEKNYQLQLDRTSYVIHYEVFAPNLMPTIRVYPR